MVRTIGAVLAGFAVMALTVMIGTIAAAVLLIPGGIKSMQGGPHDGAVPRGYLVANLTISLAAAMLGGFVATRLAGTNSWLPSILLGGLLGSVSVVAAAAQAARNESGQPNWYSKIILVIAVGGVFLGALIAAR